MEEKNRRNWKKKKIKARNVNIALDGKKQDKWVKNKPS